MLRGIVGVEAENGLCPTDMWISTVVDGRVIEVIQMHGGVKFYTGAAKAARAYIERDRSPADDY